MPHFITNYYYWNYIIIYTWLECFHNLWIMSLINIYLQVMCLCQYKEMQEWKMKFLRVTESSSEFVYVKKLYTRNIQNFRKISIKYTNFTSVAHSIRNKHHSSDLEPKSSNMCLYNLQTYCSCHRVHGYCTSRGLKRISKPDYLSTRKDSHRIS